MGHEIDTIILKVEYLISEAFKLLNSLKMEFYANKVRLKVKECPRMLKYLSY